MCAHMSFRFFYFSAPAPHHAHHVMSVGQARHGLRVPVLRGERAALPPRPDGAGAVRAER